MKQFEKELTRLASLDGVTIDTEAVHDGEKVKEHFCAHLPYAIKGHEMALAVIPNPFARLIIGLAITLLKALGNRFCEEAKANATTEG